MAFLYNATDIKTKVSIRNGAHAILVHADVKASYDAATGLDEERRLVTRTWMRTELINQLGQENYERVVKCIDFEHETGYVIMQVVSA